MPPTPSIALRWCRNRRSRTGDAAGLHTLGAGIGWSRQTDHDAPTAPMSWMESLNRMFSIDLSIRPDCGGRLRVIADVTPTDIIHRISEHVARQQAPPEFGATSDMATLH